jgi:glycosyltransferase involved in cell wall biosynthesis
MERILAQNLLVRREDRGRLCRLIILYIIWESHPMKQLTLPPVVIADNEVPVICTIRNELTLLPHFFEHYRRLGAGPFIMIDNGSDDGSLDYLLSQDCHVFYTSSSFREARFGINWVNEAVRRFCLGKWFIFVDCDELFVYPNCEFTSIAQFCFDLSRMHYDTVFAFMLDMYPDIPLSQAKLYGMSSVLKEFCWFDTEYIFRRWPRRFWDRPDNIFSLQVIGGPRCRLLSSLDVQANRGAYFYTLCNQVDRFVYYLPRSGVRVLAKMWPVDIPALNKRPLNFASNPHFTFFDNHGNSNTRYAKSR